MKRILILVVAAGLLVVLPGTALAGKPDKPAAPGKTCADLVANGAVWNLGDLNEGTYAATIPACIDVPNVPAGNWDISWSITEGDRGYVKGLLFMIKDSHPGDTCWSKEILSPAVMGVTVAGDIPASGNDACGTVWTEAQESEPLVFLAMADIRGPRGGWSIKIEATPPSS